MTHETISRLSDDTRNLFYHGYDNYMKHAFPEDELKPISCRPQTRNRADPSDIGLNDVLGNYSVTLVDSLSSLAILASDPNPKQARSSLLDFQAGVKSLVALYGDGSEAGKCGQKACGFDLDSKVQVFETNIRGVGGLLSAHLFASGELPIAGYKPVWSKNERGSQATQWDDFQYDGQLLRLAHDLASRLLPAFNTSTGLPYPRVNLRHGIPFYQDADNGVCRANGGSADSREITETCSAGAGSLVLEFSTLSRLTGDGRFERLAKRAFWAVWNRRSPLNLIGGGIDAESGEWIMPALSGIGAGIDSFYEYAVKSYILLSNTRGDIPHEAMDNPDHFWHTWNQAHEAVKRHIYRSSSLEKHAFYGQSDLLSGAPRFTWIDNLSAYYSGLLVLAGQVEEAIESHLLYAALWTRYGALPERWHTYNSFIDPNFKHWAGRPEFIESTYYIYQATKDPWYLHVGEMTLRDIRRRCWTRCGWADLGDVVGGEQRDRMESFFLGETAKYLYLLFNSDHPLNRLDAPVVFSTEGHPLIIPKSARHDRADPRKRTQPERPTVIGSPRATCPVPLAAMPLTVSNIVNRTDFFHAASLAQLHLVPVNPLQASALIRESEDGPGVSIADVRSPTNYTYYPWTLPQSLVPASSVSSPIHMPLLSTLTFPNLSPDDGTGNADKGLIAMGALQKVVQGVLITSLSNLRFNMVQEPKSLVQRNEDGITVEVDAGPEYRISGIANWALGRDEKVLVSGEALQGVSPTDPHFTRVRDPEMVDIMVDIPVSPVNEAVKRFQGPGGENATVETWDDLEALFQGILSAASHQDGPGWESFSSTVNHTGMTRQTIPAILPTGPGAAPLPAILDREDYPIGSGHLPFRNIFFLDSELCLHRLPVTIARSYQVLIIRRGGCSFGEKLANIASFAPSSEALQLVIVISSPGERAMDANGELLEEGRMIRPLLEERQTTPSGVERRNPLSMVMIHGSPEHVAHLRSVAVAVGRFDEDGRLFEQQKAVANAEEQPGASGLFIKRRYWFESLGVPIGNLVML